MGFAAASRMQRQWTELMDSSERLVQVTARAARGEVSLAANRLLQDHCEWLVWEKEFGAALRRIVIPVRREDQIRTLRVAGFSWIHDVMPFQHVRDRALRGERRQRVIIGLHNTNGFARAMVTEYRNYIRSTCSLACCAYIGESMLGDDIFVESMRRYGEVYSEYFRSYCDLNFLAPEPDAAGGTALLPLLKRQVDELRRAILDYPRSANWLEKELQLRARSGDTQQLPRFS
jgi:hypothetical protein